MRVLKCTLFCVGELETRPGMLAIDADGVKELKVKEGSASQSID
jgi:hypothetical protein